MKKFLPFLLVFLLFSCNTIQPPPKYAEEASQSVYATHDSIKAGRVELADKYAEESIRLITPPNNRIIINPVIKPGTKDERVIIVPPWFKGIDVVVVGTKEYQDLQQSAVIAKQLEGDLKELQNAKLEVDAALIAERARIDNMKEELEKTKLQLSEADGAIWKRNFIIIGMGVLIGLYAYIKIKGLFLLPF
jgi:hypothetical protein